MSEEHNELTDIDYDSKDVFETSDFEDSVEITEASPSHSRRSSIEVLESTPENSREAFERKILDNVNADFSNKISNPSPGSYQLYSTPETFDQKLIRIRAELEELSILKQDTVMSQSQMAEIDSLIKSVSDDFCLKATNSDPVNTSSLDIEKINLTPEKTASNIPVSSILDIETRISRLEKVIGASNPLEQHDKFTIQSLINDLYRKLNIMSNPDYTRTEVRPLIESLSRYSNKADGRGSSMFHNDVLTTNTADDKTVKFLYNKVMSLPSFESVLPEMLDKLKSLNSLNVELAKGVNEADDYQNQIFTLENSFKEWQEYLKKYESKLDELDAKSEANKREVDGWVDNIQNKLETLH